MVIPGWGPEVASRTVLGKAGEGLVRRFDCRPWLATDAQDEGSGPTRRGLARLQHMSGSRGWPWLLGTVA
jgi:hypothetical protein